MPLKSGILEAKGIRLHQLNKERRYVNGETRQLSASTIKKFEEISASFIKQEKGPTLPQPRPVERMTLYLRTLRDWLYNGQLRFDTPYQRGFMADVQFAQNLIMGCAAGVCPMEGVVMHIDDRGRITILSGQQRVLSALACVVGRVPTRNYDPDLESKDSDVYLIEPDALHDSEYNTLGYYAHWQSLRAVVEEIENPAPTKKRKRASPQPGDLAEARDKLKHFEYVNRLWDSALGPNTEMLAECEELRLKRSQADEDEEDESTEEQLVGSYQYCEGKLYSHICGIEVGVAAVYRSTSGFTLSEVAEIVRLQDETRRPHSYADILSTMPICGPALMDHRIPANDTLKVLGPSPLDENSVGGGNSWAVLAVLLAIALYKNMPAYRLGLLTTDNYFRQYRTILNEIETSEENPDGANTPSWELKAFLQGDRVCSAIQDTLHFVDTRVGGDDVEIECNMTIDHLVCWLACCVEHFDSPLSPFSEDRLLELYALLAKSHKHQLMVFCAPVKVDDTDDDEEDSDYVDKKKTKPSKYRGRRDIENRTDAKFKAMLGKCRPEAAEFAELNAQYAWVRDLAIDSSEATIATSESEFRPKKKRSDDA